MAKAKESKLEKTISVFEKVWNAKNQENEARAVRLAETRRSRFIFTVESAIPDYILQGLKDSGFYLNYQTPRPLDDEGVVEYTEQCERIFGNTAIRGYIRIQHRDHISDDRYAIYIGLLTLDPVMDARWAVVVADMWETESPGDFDPSDFSDVEMEEVICWGISELRAVEAEDKALKAGAK